MMKTWHLTLALGAALLVPAAGRTEDKAPTDNDFLIKAVTGGVAEVKFSQRAEKQAESPEVKDLARQMAADHKKANENLLKQARGLKVGVVAGLGKDHREIDSRLSKLTGADFDQAYVKQMIEDHEKAIGLYEAYSKSGENQALRDFAKETLPTLRKHLEHARSVQKKISK